MVCRLTNAFLPLFSLTLWFGVGGCSSVSKEGSRTRRAPATPCLFFLVSVMQVYRTRHTLDVRDLWASDPVSNTQTHTNKSTVTSPGIGYLFVNLSTGGLGRLGRSAAKDPVSASLPPSPTPVGSTWIGRSFGMFHVAGKVTSKGDRAGMSGDGEARAHYWGLRFVWAGSSNHCPSAPLLVAASTQLLIHSSAS